MLGHPWVTVGITLGIGYVDAQSLAATPLAPDARLWTADRRLAAAAARLGCAADLGRQVSDQP